MQKRGLPLSEKNTADVEAIKAAVDNLPPETWRRLLSLLKLMERMEGWCQVNRAVGKFVLFTIIAGLILFSDALDALRNLFGFMTRHHP